MEKTENRIRFRKNLKDLIAMLKINEELMNGLRSDDDFREDLKCTEGWSEDQIRVYILVELTHGRSTCQAVTDVLDACGQKELAIKLNELNKSKEPMPLDFHRPLTVVKCRESHALKSNYYTLDNKVRGKCVIVLDIPDLVKQAMSMKHIFEQLYFDVEDIFSPLSEQNLFDYLKTLRQTILKKDEAFVFMTISHGRDERLRLNNDDLIDIKEVFDLFSDDNCPALKDKPKLFFFDCCRINTGDEVENIQMRDLHRAPQNNDGNEAIGGTASDRETSMVVDHHDQNNVQVYNKKHDSVKNLDTFVAYSCLKGYTSNYKSYHGYTYFGLALSHSIAQYACDETLNGIMTRTSTRLTKIYHDLKSKGELNDLGSFAIEVNNYSMKQLLHFNPGFPKKR